MLVIYNYSCIYADCWNKKNNHITKDDSVRDREEICPICGRTMKRMGRACNSYLGSFDSKSPGEKREILKKRSDRHSRTDRHFKEHKNALENGEIND